jgi:hypothetical protein
VIWSIFRFIRIAVLALGLGLLAYVGYLASHIDHCVSQFYDAGRNPEMAEVFELLPESSRRNVKGAVFSIYLAPCDYERYRSHLDRAQLGLVYGLFWSDRTVWDLARGHKDSADWNALLQDEGIPDLRTATEPQKRCLINRFLGDRKKPQGCAVAA